MRKFFHPATEAEWLELRLSDVTSTECASLFYDALASLPTYCATPLEYWHQKRDCKVIEWEGNERTEWGLIQENGIAKRISEKYGVKVRRLSAYVRHDCARMGASFDFEIVGILDTVAADTTLQEMYVAHGPGILEIKVVDYFIFIDENKWNKGKRRPDHIDLQVQHQLEVIDRQWTALAAFVGGNKMHIMICERDVELGRAIVTRVNEFWKMIEDNVEPKADFSRDAEFISKLFSYAEPGTFMDATGDAHLDKLCAEYKKAANDEKHAKDSKDTAKAEILTIIGDNEKAATLGYKISAGVIAETRVEAFNKKAYRNIRITKLGEK